MKLTIDGKYIGTFASDAALALFADENEVDIEGGGVELTFTPRELKERIRRDIGVSAGDTESILGTTADGAQLVFHGLASLASKLSTAQSLAEVRDAAAPFAELSATFLAKIDSGDVVLPFMQKGVDTVVTDIETRATAVAGVLNASSG